MINSLLRVHRVKKKNPDLLTKCTEYKGEKEEEKRGQKGSDIVTTRGPAQQPQALHRQIPKLFGRPQMHFVQIFLAQHNAMRGPLCQENMYGAITASYNSNKTPHFTPPKTRKCNLQDVALLTPCARHLHSQCVFI